MRPKRQREILGIVLTSFLVATLAVGIAQEGDVAAVDDVRQQWQTRSDEGDAEGVADLYTEDAILYPGDGGVVEGRDAIREHMQQNFDAGFQDSDVRATETEILNGEAYSIGTWSATSADGERVHGHWMVIFRSDDGEWKIHRHLNNLDVPEPAM